MNRTMPTATFYTHVSDRHRFACRLAQRAVQSGSRVLVWASDADEAAALDTRLWSFEAVSFLPHEIWHTNTAYPNDIPLVIASSPSLPIIGDDVTVLNLSPDFWCDAPSTPARVLEIVSANLEELAEARERFKAYKQQHFAIEHHNMQGKA